MGDEKKVVWVLGSGFSRSLGGPLLEELFDPHRWMAAGQMLNDENSAGRLTVDWELLEGLGRVHRFYALVKEHKLEPPWSNAEQFLEMWETATDPTSPQRARFRYLMLNILHKLASKSLISTDEQKRLMADMPEQFVQHPPSHAKSYLAAMTHEFLHGAQPGGERWGPYMKWARGFRDGDEIITFNYDLVVEKAFEAAGDSKRRSCRQLGTRDDEFGTLHKLHGSVDWCIIGDPKDPRIDVVKDPLAHLTRPGALVGIGIPGPGKMSASSALFAPQWNRAREALKHADVIIIVGYSFPATDNCAKDELLEAMRGNVKKDLAIHLVLGPHRDSTIIRLEKMLRWVLRRRTEGTSRDYAASMTTLGPRPAHAGVPSMFQLFDTSMYAEDFLTVFDRDAL